jgi:glycosyltransferase involved in cell wall biosynthesis
MALVPPGLASLVTRAGAHGGMWTGVQMPELMRLRHDAFRALMRELDVVVAVSEWVRELLLRNGVNGEKIILSRQGVAVGRAGAARDPRAHRDGLRAALLGRLDPTKGVHVVLEALRRAPDLPVSVDVFGISQDATHERYGERVRALAGGDARVRFLPAIPREHVVETLADYDVVLVPSQYPETGPLVVLEAFAAGTPVVGSRLGGIIERVRHEIDGLLVDAMSAPAWTLALQRLVAEPGLLARLRAGVTFPRTMTEVAAEMAALYERVAAPTGVAAAPRG